MPADDQAAACDHCDDTGEVLEPSRTPEEPDYFIPCANCQPDSAATCCVRGCENDATEVVQATATRTVWQPLPYELERVEMDVPLCDFHYGVVTAGVYERLSVDV